MEGIYVVWVHGGKKGIIWEARQEISIENRFSRDFDFEVLIAGYIRSFNCFIRDIKVLISL